MPHAPSAVASCEWGYDAVARLRRAVGSTLGRVSDMLLTLWALRWCWVGMLAVVAYLRHAVSRGCVESRHAPLRSAYRVTAECRRSATMSADVGGDGMARGGDDAMSARWRRAIFSNPIRMSAARTHGALARHHHPALRRCATTPEKLCKFLRVKFAQF